MQYAEIWNSLNSSYEAYNIRNKNYLVWFRFVKNRRYIDFLDLTVLGLAQCLCQIYYSFHNLCGFSYRLSAGSGFKFFSNKSQRATQGSNSLIVRRNTFRTHPAKETNCTFLWWFIRRNEMVIGLKLIRWISCQNSQ